MDKKQTYGMFLFIHSLVVNNKDQELKEGEIDDLWNSNVLE